MSHRLPKRHLAATFVLVGSCVVLAVTALGLVTGRFRIVPVLSGSMEPAIAAGSAVILTPEPLTEIRVGQVIVYRIPIGDRHTEVHRIVRIVTTGAKPIVVTKGDANGSPDPWQARLQGDVASRVRLTVPWIGRAILAVGAPLVRTLSLVGAIAALLAAGFRWIWGAGAPLVAEGEDELAA